MLASYLNHANKLCLDINFESVFQLVPADGVSIAPHTVFQQGSIPRIQQSHSINADLFNDVIFLVRDPLDTLVSFYFHEARQWHRPVGSIGAFVCARAVGWVAYMNTWTKRLPLIRSMVLRYEDCGHDEDSYLPAVLRFAGVLDICPEAVNLAIEQAKFLQMQAKEVSGPFIPGHRYDLADTDARRVRRGKIGGWRDYLAQQDVEAVRRCIQQASTPALKIFLDKYGYSAYYSTE